MSAPAARRPSRSSPIGAIAVVVATSLAAGAGCTGILVGEEGGGTTEGSDPDGHLPPESCDPDAGHFVGISLVRRLTPRQYDRSVAQLLGDESRPADAFPVPTREHGYDNQANSQHVQRQEVEEWERAAVSVAQGALDRPDVLSGCDRDAADFGDCFAAALPSLVEKTLRGPRPDGELERYLSFYRGHERDAGAERAAELVLQVLLLSPRFLFVVEEGTPVPSASSEEPLPEDEETTEAGSSAPAGLRKLTPFEVATRLSLSLFNAAPDEELLARAKAGELESPAQVAELARAMLADERARDVILDFHSQWIDLAEVENMVLDESLDESVKQSARREVEWFLSDWYTEQGGRIGELFTSPKTWMDEPLATLYGVAAPEDGSGPMSLPEDQRAGLLTRAVFLGTHGIPPTRGDYILERILCRPVPPLPIVPPSAPDLGPSATTRERFEVHAEDPCAAGCHGLIDPIGFAFEHYDSVGRFRTTENGKPVDASTVLPFEEGTGLSGGVEDAIELSRAIADSPLSGDCMVENWFRYALGRAAQPADRCSVRRSQEALHASSGEVRELLVALVTSDAFLYLRKDTP